MFCTGTIPPTIWHKRKAPLPRLTRDRGFFSSGFVLIKAYGCQNCRGSKRNKFQTLYQNVKPTFCGKEYAVHKRESVIDELIEKHSFLHGGGQQQKGKCGGKCKYQCTSVLICRERFPRRIYARAHPAAARISSTAINPPIYVTRDSQ